MTHPVPLLAVLLGLAACAPADSGPGARGGGGAADGAALPDTAMVRHVDPTTTAALVAGDLGRVSPSVAIQTLDLWIARLDSVEAGAEVRDDLETLRRLLQSSPLDGPAIGRAMRAAGEGTAALADSTDGLGGLARVLRVAGDRLAPDTTAVGTVNEGTDAVQ